MKHKIDPAVDCVFKAILGNERRKNLLLHFLNSILEYHDDPEKKIEDVSILNPYNERKFEEDKLNVVDVKARDISGRYYHIEIQITAHPNLPQRMLYTWSAIYHSQLGKGDDYFILTPVISIWVITGSLFVDLESCHLPFYVYNAENKLSLSDHFVIHVLQLAKWKARKKGISEKDRWIYLFKEGQHLDIDNPPDIIKQSEEMRQVMNILAEFSENQRDFLLYQSRLEGEMVLRTFEKALEKERKEKEEERREKEKERREKEEERKEKEKERKEKEKERKEKELALKEIKRLKKLLKNSLPSDTSSEGGGGKP
jgi:predicted transposase/invertase (TIGR01784 family)